MTILDIFWIFFMISALSPLVRQKFLELHRLQLLQKFERKKKSRAIALIHRQETMSLLGFPIMRYIDIQDSEEVLRAIHLTDPDIPIDLILHTPGGLVLPAEQIARALCRHKGRVTVYIPHYAMSGGTLLALAADEIVMDQHAVLGPVDPQIGEFPAISVLKVLEQKDKNEIDDKTLIMADVGRKAVEQVKKAVIEIMAPRIEKTKAEEIANTLIEGGWTHDHPITAEEARNMGLPVSRNVPKEIYDLMSLYPQPTRRTPTVQYIPYPYRKSEKKR